jgi:hypothetical protein
MEITKNTDTNYKKIPQPMPPITPTQEQIIEAVKRLRQLGETLPPVDAVAVVRESRDSASERIRQ